MHFKRRQWISSILTFLASTSAFAQFMPYGTLSAPCGWYIEGNVGSSHISGTNFPGNASSSGIGGSAYLGYKFFPFFATELMYTRYANTSIEVPLTETKAATVKHYSYGIDVKGILPVWATGLEVFAKVGAQRIVSQVSTNNQLAARILSLTSTSHSRSGPYADIGGQFNWTPEFATVVQWAHAWGNGSTGSGDLFSIGIAFIAD